MGHNNSLYESGFVKRAKNEKYTKEMTPYLLHTNMSKDGDTFYFTMRTNEGAELIKEAAQKKGIKVVVTVKPPPKYYASKQHYLEHLLENNPIFKEFYDTLALKLVGN